MRSKMKTLGLVLAVIIAVSLIQASLVFACSMTGNVNGQGAVNGNGNPGGQCFGATHGLTFGISSDPRCGGGGAGPASGPPGAN
ncbi:MAG: hypothetical protein ABSF63_02950 [Candidatus Bathyarchaeia archaeon]